MDWLDLLAVQGTLKSLLPHHSSKASILQCSVFFTVQLSHPYMTTGKTIALTRWTFVGKVMPLLFNMLSRLVITFLPRSSSVQSVQFSRSVVSNSSQPHESQHTRPPCPSPTPGVYTNSNHLILCHPRLLLPPIPPSIRVFSNKSVFCIRWPKYRSVNFSISPSNEYSGLISFRNGLVGSPCSPGDSQESSPTPQFKSINSSALSFLYSLTLTSIHDYWKNHSFD